MNSKLQDAKLGELRIVKELRWKAQPSVPFSANGRDGEGANKDGIGHHRPPKNKAQY